MKFMKILFILFCLFFSTKTSGAFATTSSNLDFDDEEYLDAVDPIIYDPIEGWNRAMHSFNDNVLNKVARPVSKAYTTVTPKFMRLGVKNFFYNLRFPIRFVNNILQGKGKAAGVEMSRFVLNTTAGLGGFFNVAKNKKTVVPVEDADFGQTLGKWGIGEGFYIVWPFLGPSTVRDSIGTVGDYFLDPISYQPLYISYSLSGLKAVNELDDILDTYDNINRIAIEPYTSFRDAWVQYRRAKVTK